VTGHRTGPRSDNRNGHNSGFRLGIDLGGTKIEGILMGVDDDRLRVRVDTPQGDYPGTLAAIAEVVARLTAEKPETEDLPVGIGIPGAVSRATGRIKNANSTWLIGEDLAGDLGRLLGRPVRLANDANCFALSEAVDGAGQGAASVFGVILGTGVGGGLVIDGKPVQGANDIAGEWGHNPLPWPNADELPGPECYCGLSGCIETWLSGSALAAQYQALSGQTLLPAEIAEAAAKGDAQADVALARYAERLARALAHVINLLDPEVIVLGGGLSNIDALYEMVPARWTPWVFSDRVDTRLLPNHWGDSGGVRGAAWLWD
jgi:fructokinase